MKLLDHLRNGKEDMLTTVFDHLQDGVIVLDLDLTIVLVNQWIEKQYSSKMPLIGKKCYTVFQNMPSPCAMCPFRTALETGKQEKKIIPHPSTENPTQWLEFTVSRFEDARGKTRGGICHVKDITEHKQTEEVLKDEILQRRILVEQSRDGIVILDQNGKVYEANQQYADMLGYTMEEIRQLHVWDWDTQWAKEQLLEMVRTVDITGDHFETQHRRKDGTYYDVEISTNGTVFRGQKFILCICRDITERKHAEKEREKLIGELQEALKEIKTLRGILPICSFCKKIRDDKGYWEQVDVYIKKYSQADISHGICPECIKKHYPDIKEKRDFKAFKP